MKKRLLFLVPAVAMLLAGCGKNGGDPTSTSGVTPTTEQPSTSGQPTTSGEPTTADPTSDTGTPTEPGPGSSSSVEPGPDVTPAKINVNQTWCNLVVGGDPFTFTATVQNKSGSSEGVNQAVTWTIAEGDVGKYTCVDGVVTALQEGTNMELTVASVEVPTVTKVVKVTAKDPDMTLPSMTSDGFDKVATAELTQGDSVYFAGAYGKHAYVMGKYASGNNIAAKETTVAEEKLQITGELGAEAYLVEKNSDDTYSFKDSSNKYIYAADDNGSHNYLKAAEKASISDDREKFALTSEDGVLKLRSISDKATRNTLMLNGSSKIFSCYGSGQQDIVIYHKAPVVLSGIEVKTQPTKNSYFVGDEFSSAGLEVEAVYSDLHKEPLTAEDYDLSIAEGKALVTGDSGPVTVTLKADNSKTCTFDITVAEIVLQSLEVSTPTKHEYVKGATFDPSTITVTAHYNDSRKDKVIPFKVGEEDGYTVLFDTSAAGTDKTVTVSYGGQEEVLEGFTVLDIEVVKIELISGPSSSLYYEGQPFDRTRIGVKATFNNETEDAEFEEYRVFPNRALTTSDNYVFIYFGDESLVEPTEGDLCFKLAVTVEEDSIAGIAVGTIPGSTQFSVGETFSKAALGNPTVIATHLSGKVDEPVVADSAQIHVGDEWLDEYTFTAYTDEHYTAHLVLDSIAVEFDVTMMDSVASVVVKEGSTHKVSFKSGETFSRENLVLHGVWYSGFEDDITSGFATDLDGHVFTDTDVEHSPLTVTVTYGNSVKCEYEITVKYDGLIQEGYHFIKGTFGGKSYYMDKSGSSSTYPLGTENISDAQLFNFELVGTNKYTIKVGDSYLYSNDANNGVRVGSTKDVWTIAQNGEQYLFTEGNNSRVLNIYKTPDFRAYTSTQSESNANNRIFIEDPIPVSGISLNKSESTLEVPNTETLVPTVSPDGAYNKSVTWSSSNESIATVNENGVVTAVSNGNVTITATTVDGNHTATCDYVITRPDAENITLSASLTEIVMNTGTSTLSYTVGPAGAADPGDIEYVVVSGGESISIEGNVVSATAVLGSAVIKAHSNSLSLDSNEVTISVTDGTIHVSSVSLNETEFSVVLGMSTLQLEETVLPENATDKSVTWESDDTSVATVDATGLVKTVGVGSANITVTTNDGAKTASCALTVLSNKGYIEEDPFTPDEAIAHWIATSDDSTYYYVEGFVSKIVTPYSSKYDNITVDLKGTTNDFELFRMAVTAEQADNIQVGTKIKATGTLAEHDGTCEFAAGCAPLSITNTDVYSIEISGDTSVKPGEDIQLTATAKPTGASLVGLEWSSSDEDVATVDSTGKVTGVTNGDVTITASVNGKNATYEITVSDSSEASSQYVLTPAAGSNNNYGSNCDIKINGITWNVTGNSSLIPWRIGGKSLTNVERTVYSKTALNKRITQINVEFGNASSITVNSLTLIVSANADFSDPISTVSGTFAANSVVSFKKPSADADWTNVYYKFVLNVSVSGTSNKFVEFAGAEFVGFAS